MFTDNAVVAKNDVDYTVQEVYRLVDGPTNGRTVRRSADGSKELTIAHQLSNENPGFLTRRSNVRVSLTKVDETTGKQVTGYVQFTMSVPLTEVSVGEVRGLLAEVETFLTFGGGSPGFDPTIAEPSDGTAMTSWRNSTLTRLLAGEP